MVLCLKNPEYHEDTLVQVQAVELEEIGNEENIEIEYLSPSAEKVKVEEPEVENDRKLIVMIETPEYFENIIGQVNMDEVTDDSFIENAFIEFINPGDSLLESEPEVEEDRKYQLMIKTPSYYPNKTLVVDIDAFELNPEECELEYNSDVISGSDDVISDEEISEKIVLMIETPQFYENQIISIQTDLEEIQNAPIEEQELDFIAINAEPEVEIEEPEVIIEDIEITKKLNILIQNPEYFDDVIAQVDQNEFEAGISSSNVLFQGQIPSEELNNSSEPEDEEPEALEIEEKMIIMITQPEYFQNQIVEVGRQFFENEVESSPISYLAGSDENPEPEVEPEVTEEAKKYVLCLENPEYCQNQIVQVEELSESAEIDFSGFFDKNQEFEDAEAETKLPEMLTMFVEGPEYSSGSLIQLDKANYCFNGEQTSCNFISNSPSEEEEIKNEKSEEKIILKIENPEYFENQIFQVQVQELENQIENSKIDFLIEEDVKQDSEFFEQSEIDEISKKMTLMIETPDYFENKICEVELDLDNVDDLANLEEMETGYVIGTSESPVPAIEKDSKLTLMIGNPEYFGNQILRVDSDLFFENSENAEVEFVGDAELEAVIEIEEEKPKMTLMVASPEYFTNQICQMTLADVDDDAIESAEIDFLSNSVETGNETEAETELEEIEIPEKLTILIKNPEYHDDIIAQVYQNDFNGQVLYQGKIESGSISESDDEPEVSELEALETMTIMIETPQYYPNKICQINESDLENGLENVKLEYAADSSEQPEQEVEIELEEIEISIPEVLMIGNPEYFENQIIQIEGPIQSCFDLENIGIEYLEKTFEKIEPEIDLKVPEVIMMIESPEYYLNQMIQVSFSSSEEDIEEAQINFIAPEVQPVEPEEFFDLFQKPEVDSNLIFLIETPEYYNNIVGQATGSHQSFLENPEIARFDFLTECNEPEVNIETKEPEVESEVVLMIETPEYQDNQIVKIELEDSIEQSLVTFTGEASEKPEVIKQEPEAKVILRLENPEYHCDQIVQVTGSDLDELEQLDIEHIAMELCQPEVQPEIEPQKLALLIETEEYQENQLIQIDTDTIEPEIENFEKLELDFMTSDCNVETAEIEIEKSLPVSILVETPEYQNDQIIQIRTGSQLDLIEQAEIDFLTDEPEVETDFIAPEDQPEIEGGIEPEVYTTMIITPEYYENKIVKLKLDDLLSEFPTGISEIEYFHNAEDDMLPEVTPEMDRRLKAELTAKLIHGYDFVLEQPEVELEETGSESEEQKYILYIEDSKQLFTSGLENIESQQPSYVTINTDVGLEIESEMNEDLPEVKPEVAGRRPSLTCFISIDGEEKGEIIEIDSMEDLEEAEILFRNDQPEVHPGIGQPEVREIEESIQQSVQAVKVAFDLHKDIDEGEYKLIDEDNGIVDVVIMDQNRITPEVEPEVQFQPSSQQVNRPGEYFPVQATVPKNISSFSSLFLSQSRLIYTI